MVLCTIILTVIFCHYGVSSVEVDEAVLKNILDRLAQLEERNARLEETANRQKRLILATELPITFTTRVKRRVVDHVQPGDIISFDSILTNYGGGLDSNTSIFTAPMAGIYILSCSLVDSFARNDGSGAMLHADIVKNGNVVLGRVFAHAEGSQYRDQGSQTVFVELQAGDQVWIRNWDSKDLTLGGELYSTFSGYLLWPLE